jgi:hypothetical protein
LDVWFGQFGRCDTPLAVFNLPQRSGKLLPTVVLTPELFSFSRTLSFLFGELSTAADGALRRLSPDAVPRRGRVCGRVRRVRDALVFLVGLIW